MSEFLYNLSFLVAAAVAVATVWQFFTSSDSPPSERTPDIPDAYDDDCGSRSDHGGDADDD